MNQHHDGYTITFENGRYVARSTDGDDIVIYSTHRPRVLGAIAAFWNVLNNMRSFGTWDQSTIERMPAPRWMREWLSNPTSRIDLDAAYARGAC